MTTNTPESPAPEPSAPEPLAPETSAPETSGPADSGLDRRVTNDTLRDLAGLRRSRSDKKVAGVAGGIARHLDIDPIIVRVLLVVLIFFGGAGLIVYVGCWLLVPVEGNAQAILRLDERSRGVALALVGLIAALALLGDSLGGWGFPWPLAVLGVIVTLVLLYRGRRARSLPEPRYAASHEPGSGPIGHTASPLVARAKRGGPLLFWYALALTAIGIGILGIFDLAGADVTKSAYPALGLIVCAALLVLGAFWGRPGGLILLGLVSAVATAGTVTASELQIGRLSPTPLTSSELRADYNLDIGEIDLDLNEVRDLEGLDGRRIDLEVDLGRIEVLVPDGLDVTVVSDLGGGDSSVFGVENNEGTANDSLDGGVAAPSLTLYVTVGLGEIEIARDGGR